MSIDYYIYLGPYIEIENELTKEHKISSHYCNNRKCNNYKGKVLEGKFCAFCGNEVKEIIKNEIQKADIFEILEENNLSEELTTITSREKEVLVSATGANGAKWNIKYEDIFEDLTDISIKIELDRFVKEHSDTLRKLEKIFKSKPVVRYGLIRSVN